MEYVSFNTLGAKGKKEVSPSYLRPDLLYPSRSAVVIMSGEELVFEFSDGRRKEEGGCWRAMSFQFVPEGFDMDGACVVLKSLGVREVRSDGEVPGLPLLVLLVVGEAPKAGEFGEPLAAVVPDNGLRDDGTVSGFDEEEGRDDLAAGALSTFVSL
jgi:hypothetical protein